MKSKWILLINFFIVNLTFAQDLEYAQQVVKTLTSREYAGRGYAENGDKKAAKFISREFEKFGLRQFEGSYFQEFKISIPAYYRHVIYHWKAVILYFPMVHKLCKYILYP